MADTEFVVRGLNEGFDVLHRDIQELIDLQRGAERTIDDGAKKSQTSLRNIADAYNEVSDAAGRLKDAAEAAIEFVSAGADLNLAQQQFGNLATSIGSTSDVLNNQLRAATRGMVSDAELMAASSDLISQKLAKSQDEVVRMGRLVGELGWQMDTLGLTLNNLSFKRLDTLGLAIEDVKPRMQELVSLGHETEEAFKLALLEAGEQKLELLGSAAESTAGDIALLNAEWQNLIDTQKSAVATALAPTLRSLADSRRQMDALEAAVKRGAITQGQLSGAMARGGEVGVTTAEKLARLEDVITEFDQRMAAAVETSGSFDRAMLASAPPLERRIELTDELMEKIGGSMGADEEAMMAAMAADEMDRRRARTIEARIQAHADAEQAILDQAEAERQAAAEAEKARARMVGLFQDTAAPVEDLFDAQQALIDAQGEWVQVTRDNSGEVASINAQLAADLSDEQKKAMREILTTVDEGSAEWLSAYNALQNDLTDSARAGLVAQRAELQAASGTISSVYTGDSAAAEEAQARIEAANLAIAQSYRETAFEGILATQGVTQGALDYAVAAGIMSQAQADQRLSITQTTAAIKDLAASGRFYNLTTQQQIAATNAIANGQISSADAAIQQQERQQAAADALAAFQDSAVPIPQLNADMATTATDMNTAVGDVTSTMDIGAATAATYRDTMAELGPTMQGLFPIFDELIVRMEAAASASAGITTPGVGGGGGGDDFANFAEGIGGR